MFLPDSSQFSFVSSHDGPSEHSIYEQLFLMDTVAVLVVDEVVVAIGGVSIVVLICFRRV